MSTSISVVCYKSKELANGEHPLMIRVCKDNNRQYQSLGISIRKEFWNFKKGKPKSNCPNKELIEKIISNKLQELTQTLIELKSEQREFSSSTLLVLQKEKIVDVTFGRFTKAIIDKMLRDGKIGNQLVYKRVYTSIFKYTKGKIEIPFYEINNEWLLKYEKWLRNNKNKDTSISIIFRTLRSIYNKAIKEKCARRENYPFDEFCISKFNTSTKKRAIDKDQILKLNGKIKGIGKREYVELSKDLFLFSYYCGGINFIDMANLTKNNFTKNGMSYIRQKTGKQISIRVPDPAQKIISKYINNDNGYVFPIFNKSIHITPLQKHNRAHKIMTKVNRNLKDLASQLHIDGKITTYVARHSFATTLKKSGVDIAMISELLGHSDLSTTQIYLDSFDNDQIDNALKNLL